MIRICLILGVFILLSNFFVAAQNPAKLDSLLAANQNHPQRDTFRINNLLSIARLYSRVNPANGIEASEEALQISNELAWPLFQGKSHLYRALNLFQLGDYDEAISELTIAQTFLEPLDSKKELGVLFTLYGAIAFFRGDYPAAELSYTKATKLYEALGDAAGQARVLMNIGLLQLNIRKLDEAKETFNTVIPILRKAREMHNLSQAYDNLASVYFQQTQLDTALFYFQKALEIDKNNQNKGGMLLRTSNIALVYMEKGNYPQAINWYQEAMRLGNALGDKKSITNGQLNIGSVYYNLGDYTKAGEYFEQALQGATKLGMENVVGKSFTCLALNYFKKNDLAKAELYGQKALDVFQEIEDPRAFIEAQGALARVYLEQKNFQKSLELFQATQKMSESESVDKSIALNLYGIASCYFFGPDSLLSNNGIRPENRYTAGLQLLEKALSITQSTQLLDIEQDILNSMSFAYEQIGDYPKAYDALLKKIKIYEEISDQDVKKQITRKEIQFEFDQKEAALKFEQQLTQEQLEQQKLLSFQQQQALQINQQSLALSNQEKDLQRLAYLKEKAEKQEKEQLLSLAEKDKQLQDIQLGALIQEKALQLKTLAEKNALIGFLIAGISAILLAFAAFYWWIRQRQAKKEAAIQAQFTRQLLENIEDDRGRIAIDLHDSVSHDLLLLKQSIRKEITGPDVGDKIDNIINGIRQISRNLHPVMLDKIGLGLSLETLCEQFMQHETMYVSHDIQYQNTLSKPAELQLFRIVQEGLTNALKYSKAEAVKVVLAPSGHSLRLEIQDNGKGFEVEKALEGGKAFGLHSIIQRAKAIGGKAEIKSGAGGTTIGVMV